MKDFPLDELLAATDLSRIQEGIFQIFAHINKKLKLSYVHDIFALKPLDLGLHAVLTQSDESFRSLKLSLQI